jgi:hypothetical protein
MLPPSASKLYAKPFPALADERCWPMPATPDATGFDTCCAGAQRPCSGPTENDDEPTPLHTRPLRSERRKCCLRHACGGVFDDPLFGKTSVRADGRVIHDMYLVEVKKPDESKKPHDYYKVISVIPGDKAFRPMVK